VKVEFYAFFASDEWSASRSGPFIPREILIIQVSEKMLLNNTQSINRAITLKYNTVLKIHIFNPRLWLQICVWQFEAGSYLRDASTPPSTEDILITTEILEWKPPSDWKILLLAEDKSSEYYGANIITMNLNVRGVAMKFPE